jgi:hypothetical protein
MRTADFYELACQSPQERDRATSLTGAATTNIQSILIREKHLKEDLRTLQEHGINPQVKESNITEEDMWPTWPQDPE